MSQQGDRSTGHQDDWWGQLYDDSTGDTGPAPASDSLDDRFASAAGTLGQDAARESDPQEEAAPRVGAPPRPRAPLEPPATLPPGPVAFPPAPKPPADLSKAPAGTPKPPADLSKAPASTPKPPAARSEPQ
ncbi:hypothetical protein C3488_39455, partial [Streptomyces sp. Ru72]